MASLRSAHCPTCQKFGFAGPLSAPLFYRYKILYIILYNIFTRIVTYEKGFKNDFNNYYYNGDLALIVTEIFDRSTTCFNFLQSSNWQLKRDLLLRLVFRSLSRSTVNYAQSRRYGSYLATKGFLKMCFTIQLSW